MYRLTALALAALLAGCASAPDFQRRAGHIKNVVVIYAENHSFDNMYGMFPGANGIANATPAQYTQLGHDGKPLPELVVWGGDGKPNAAYPRMPNKPFRIDAPPLNKPPTQIVPSPVHAFFHNQEQINGGANNMFAAMSTVGGWTMGYYDGSQFRLWKWAQEYTLADNFFMGAFGGSYLNHQYLICACAPRHDTAPASMRIRLDANGKLEKRPGSPAASEGAVQVFSGGGVQVTPDGWSVNTTQPPWQPSGVPPAANGPLNAADPAGNAAQGVPLPPQTTPTIGDRLSARGISWAWYAGAYKQALADGEQPASVKRKIIYERADNSPAFQPHHQPFNYYARFAPGTADRAKHLLDGSDFERDIAAGTLPAVSFYKPAGRDTQHPSYTDIMTGDMHIDGLLQKLRASPQWKDMLVIVTYDENGGYWDHVPPPTGPGWGDKFGPGTRIPTLLIGPTVRKHHVDSTAYDTTSILKFVTKRFGLEPLPGVREKMGDFSSALE
ncbi:acid phosphatase [Caenimonas aquaedulcis]|uniref:Acid phosphatase n=1 Tax=Caenimonas aquaedulcis TaxID=2793270 RepID=A0A931MEB1_9BURK|nr:acid phosphatase [Caenimonas aquaedulcis]MBG9386626.1 acid phosphatase [Caenimonas aquaedulcis]